MGSNPTKAVQNLDFSDKAPTSEEKQLLQRSWSDAKAAANKDNKKLGEILFRTMLSRGKKIRELFKFDSISDQVMENERFRNHAAMLEEGVDRLVNMTDGRIIKEAQRLATVHFKKNMDFNPVYWRIFPAVMVELMEPYADMPGIARREVLDAWLKFCEHIVDIMQVTYVSSSKIQTNVSIVVIGNTKNNERALSVS